MWRRLLHKLTAFGTALIVVSTMIAQGQSHAQHMTETVERAAFFAMGATLADLCHDMGAADPRADASQDCPLCRVIGLDTDLGAAQLASVFQPNHAEPFWPSFSPRGFSASLGPPNGARGPPLRV